MPLAIAISNQIQSLTTGSGAAPQPTNFIIQNGTPSPNRIALNQNTSEYLIQN